MNKWNRAYRKIVSISSRDKLALVEFLNGEIVEVVASTLVPKGFDKPLWDKASIDSDGVYIVVPALPTSFEVPWYTVRTVTDVEFSRYMAKRAGDHAREVGKRIRVLRESRGLTQARIALATGIEPGNLSRIENGQFDVATSTLWKILAAMGCSPKDFVSFRSDLAEGS